MARHDTNDGRPGARGRRLWLPVVSLGALLGCGTGGDAEPQYRHVLLVSLDTTRADQIGCYGAEEVQTPVLDQLASEGVRFADCTSAAATTLASHTSLMTGLVPLRHGVPRNGFVLDGDNVTLAERLAAVGFHCAAFLGSAALSSRTGFDRGFAHYDEDFDVTAGTAGADQSQRDGTAVTAAVLAHVDEMLAREGADEGRLFLFAHYFDPHAPYAPPAREVQRYRASFPVGDFARIEEAVRQQQQRTIGRPLGQSHVINEGLSEALLNDAPGVPTATGRDLARLYAGEMTSTDAALGRLLAGLASRGVLDETLVIVTADHGETFWEHGNFWNHGLWVAQTDVHVPLLVRFPDGRGAGRVVAEPVSGVDVAPTVFALLGLRGGLESEADVVRGRSLVAAIDGAPLSERPLFACATQPGPRVEAGVAPWIGARKPIAVRRGPYKLVDAPYLDLEQLFHLGRDPGERTDLLGEARLDASDAAALEDLRADLAALRAAATPRPSTFDREQAAALLGLGYAESRAPEDGR